MHSAGEASLGRLGLFALVAFVWGSLMVGCSPAAESAAYGQRPAQTRDELLAARKLLRAYDGAPPVIPHQVAALGRQECLNCHQAGSPQNADRIAPPRSHPAWGDCRQCHAERLSDSVFQANTLEAVWWPAKGSTLYPGAPPTIPHRLQNREDCVVCHIGEQASAALRAAHGMRPNCRQCHAAGEE